MGVWMKVLKEDNAELDTITFAFDMHTKSWRVSGAIDGGGHRVEDTKTAARDLLAIEYSHSHYSRLSILGHNYEAWSNDEILRQGRMRGMSGAVEKMRNRVRTFDRNTLGTEACEEEPKRSKKRALKERTEGGTREVWACVSFAVE